MKKIIGQIIKERVDAQNLNVVDFAKMINKERTTVYDIFSRDSIDTDLLKKIGQVLHYDFFQEFLEPETVKEIVLRNSMTNKIYVELTLTDDEAEAIGLDKKIVKHLKE